MAKKSMILKQQAEPKFSTRRYNRCKICGVPRLPAGLRHLPYLLPRAGLQGSDSRCQEGELVKPARLLAGNLINSPASGQKVAVA